MLLTVTYLGWTPSQVSQRFYQNFIQSVMTCYNFENTYFREDLLMVFFRTPESGCCIFHKATALISTFFSKYSYLKNHRKKHVPSFSLPWWKKIPSLLFIMFSWLLFIPKLFKNFSLPKKCKDFDFFNLIPGGGAIFIFLIYLEKYLTSSAKNWPEGKSWLPN